ncbi:MAG: SHOCT domain-containing protein [Desulfuromonadales bacterium]
MMHDGGMMNGWGMMGPLMWLFMILLWGFAMLGVVCAVRWLVSRNKTGEDQDSPAPLDILKARYARGEISREEFERMKKDME